MKRNHRRTIFLAAVAVLSSILLFYIAQRFWAHRDKPFLPDYPQVALSETTNSTTIFLQTGLSCSALEKLPTEERFDTIKKAQDAFFHPPSSQCTPLLGWFTREDRLSQKTGIPLIDLQPGDILLTLSTHSAGWRHGHAGLAVDSDTVLESTVLGSNSTLVSAAHWTAYSNYVVLRLKQITPDLQQQVINYSLTHLIDVPYRLFAGLTEPKAPDPDSAWFGLHCSYLIWYAWNHFGYDLDSDGGRLVTAQDLLHSDLLEVVQVFGMDPHLFLS